jgi:hypothetical protein
MKRLLALLVSLVAMAAAVAGAATPAQKVPLTKTNRGCSASVTGAEQTQPFGFVNLIKPAADKLVAAVVLQGATPNAVYNIRLIQILPGGVAVDCFIIDGTLATDSSGDGSRNVQEAVVQGATSAWVDLNNQADNTDFYDTAALSF